MGLSASRLACALPHFESGSFRIGQRKPIIRTRPLSETDSDYMDLVRETGLEPVRHKHTHLKRACLPVPALAQNKDFWKISMLIIPPPWALVNQ